MSADTRQCLVNLNSFRIIRLMRFLLTANRFPFLGTMTPNLAVLAFVSTERTFTLPFLCKKRPLRNTSVNCCARNSRALRGNVVTVMVYQTVRRLRPLARLAFNTCRPAFVAIRARKPCVRLRFRLLGWNVLFIARLVFLTEEVVEPYDPFKTMHCPAGFSRGGDSMNRSLDCQINR
jgi:hypothetical protein